jgi:hypothetical protein
LAYGLRSCSRWIMNGGKRSKTPPSPVRVLSASHVMYVGCDVGGRNGDHKCGVILTSRRPGLYLINFLHLAFRSTECKDDRPVKASRARVIGDESSTRISIYLGVSMQNARQLPRQFAL